MISQLWSLLFIVLSAAGLGATARIIVNLVRR